MDYTFQDNDKDWRAKEKSLEEFAFNPDFFS